MSTNLIFIKISSLNVCRVCVRYGLSGVYLLSISLCARDGLFSSSGIPGSPLTVQVGVGNLEGRLRQWYNDTPLSLATRTRCTEAETYDVVLLSKTWRAWKRFVGMQTLTRSLQGKSTIAFQ